MQEVGRVSLVSAKWTHTPRDSCHGDCGRKQRPAPYSARKMKRERKKRKSFDKLCNSNLKLKEKKDLTINKSTQKQAPQILACRCHFPPTDVHGFMTMQRVSLERGREAALETSFALI